MLCIQVLCGDAGKVSVWAVVRSYTTCFSIQSYQWHCWNTAKNRRWASCNSRKTSFGGFITRKETREKEEKRISWVLRRGFGAGGKRKSGERLGQTAFIEAPVLDTVYSAAFMTPIYTLSSRNGRLTHLSISAHGRPYFQRSSYGLWSKRL